MTRNEQIEAVSAWLNKHDSWLASLVEHFPEFMAKCAEIGLCEPDRINQHLSLAWYGVRKPEPPHEHEWRIAGYIPHEFDLHANTAPEVRVGCRCGASRVVPNRLPIQVPED